MATLIRESHRATPHLAESIGSTKVFFARGTEFRVKRLRKTTWCLSTPGVEQLRFGTRTDILQDIEHAMDYGVLPPRSKFSCH